MNILLHFERSQIFFVYREEPLLPPSYKCTPCSEDCTPSKRRLIDGDKLHLQLACVSGQNAILSAEMARMASVHTSASKINEDLNVEVLTLKGQVVSLSMVAEQALVQNEELQLEMAKLSDVNHALNLEVATLRKTIKNPFRYEYLCGNDDLVSMCCIYWEQ